MSAWSGSRLEGGDGGAHRLVRGAQDVDLVDLDRIDDADCPDDRAVARQLAIYFFAAFRQELLGIIQPTMTKFLRQNRGRCDHRTGQRASARFIDAGDAGESDRAQSAFMAKTAAPIHAAESRTIRRGLELKM